MTDSVDNGAAQAAADATPMPEAPISEMPSTPEVSLPEPTPRNSIERALESVGYEKPDAPEPTEQQKIDRARDEKGKFVAKDAVSTEEKPKVTEQPKEPAVEQPKTEANINEPPSRFSPDAKAAWKDAPPAVKAEIHRAVKELEAGIEKYREPASKWESLKPFHEMAAQYGTDVGSALARYVNADQKLNNDLIGGLEEIVGHYGYSLRDVAAHVLGQPADQVHSQSEQTIRALKQELTDLRQQVTGVSSTIQEQRVRETQRGVEEFAKNHPRFDDLSNDIAFFLKTRTKDLQEAYDLAERLNPAPQAAPTPQIQAAPKPDPTIQTRKGSLSISGAPSSGSNPANRKPPSSARDALNRAFADVDLG